MYHIIHYTIHYAIYIIFIHIRKSMKLHIYYTVIALDVYTVYSIFHL